MRLKVVKLLLLVTCLAPAVILAVRGSHQTLGDNPVEAITYETGDWTMILLLVTLAITPVRRLTGVNEIISFRRMFGLLTFFYASLHFGTYVWLDKSFHWERISVDIGKRPFIWMGLCAFILMIPLAFTSNSLSIRRMGRRWKSLHTSVYAIAIAAVLHFVWMKRSEAKPYMYAVLFTWLLAWRVRVWIMKRRKMALSATQTTLTAHT